MIWAYAYSVVKMGAMKAALIAAARTKQGCTSSRIQYAAKATDAGSKPLPAEFWRMALLPPAWHQSVPNRWYSTDFTGKMNLSGR